MLNDVSEDHKACKKVFETKSKLRTLLKFKEIRYAGAVTLENIRSQETFVRQA